MSFRILSRFACRSLILSLALITLSVAGAAAQPAATVTGSVSSERGDPLAGAVVTLRGTRLQAVTEADGSFRLQVARGGTYELVVSLIGYRSVVRTVELRAGGSLDLELVLPLRPVEVSGVEVSVLRPDLTPQAELEERQVREANPKDSGELMRVLPGLDAVRRGPVGLDPVIRGLRETEVGVYLDGARMFPAGPARMDNQLSHIDPSVISGLEIVKGPYALTWGAGNLSAVRVKTREVPEAADYVQGSVLMGWDWNGFQSDSPERSNLQASEVSATLFGRADRWSYSGFGAWRDGNDYQAGDETFVPGDFVSRELRGNLSYETTADSRVTASGGYQNQGNIDYPGRILDAEFFESWNANGRWEMRRPSGALRAIDLQIYFNSVDHGMTNDNKPTALPDTVSGRPPLDVSVTAAMDVVGGRAAVTLAPVEPLTLEIGGDVYSADRSADRVVLRRDNDVVLFEDLIWPDVTITDAGLFVRAASQLGGIFSWGATVRADFVDASADTASEFFLTEVSTDLNENETNLSGSLNVSAAPSEHISVSLGVGSAVRTADALERYSDRFPASKAQLSNEFVGNPELEPERATQVDLGIEGSYSRLAAWGNVFYRVIDDYITLEATQLPKRLPLSPDQVFRYINGEARFWGFEAGGQYGLTSALTAAATSSFLWGEDDTVDEPAIGISPWQGTLSLRYEPPSGKYFFEAEGLLVSEQDRVATGRGEDPTDGYGLLNLQGGIQVLEGVLFRLAVNNVFDETYVNHLNAKNPFTGRQILEQGQSIVARVSYDF